LLTREYITKPVKSNYLFFQAVTKEEGDKLADSYGLKFMEASAKSRHNVNDLFASLSVDILEYRKNAGNSSGGNATTAIEPTDLNVHLDSREAAKKKVKSKSCC